MSRMVAGMFINCSIISYELQSTENPYLSEKSKQMLSHTEEQREELHEIGCDCYQGYLYSPAVFLEEEKKDQQ